MDLDLKIKRLPATPREKQMSRQRIEKTQSNIKGHKVEPRVARNPRPNEVPVLNLVDLEEEDVEYVPVSERPVRVGPPDSSSTLSWGTELSARTFQTTPWADGKVVPENLPAPSERYKKQYQQYEAELKENCRLHAQRMRESGGGETSRQPAARQSQGPGENHGARRSSGDRAPPEGGVPAGGSVPDDRMTATGSLRPAVAGDDLSAPDEGAILQQIYTGKPYTAQHGMRKLEAEDLAAERRKQAVVEQVMVDQLSRAVISDPDQVSSVIDPNSAFGMESVPLRFKKRTLHETKVQTRSSLTENLLSNKLRFDARILTRNGRDASRELIGFFFVYDNTLTVYEYRHFGKNRTNALPFIPKGCHRHQCGPRRGLQYSVWDFYVGADLSFSTHGQNLPENMKRSPWLCIRITDVDELEKSVLLGVAGEVKQGPSREEPDDRKTLMAIQGTLREKLRTRGVRTLTGLGKLLRGADTSGDGFLGKDKVRQALQQFHLTVSDKEFDTAWRILDKNSDGQVDYGDFIRAVVGEMNEYRKSFVRKAFMKLDPSKSGTASMTDIEKFYCARGHPKVLSGEATEETLRTGFLESLRHSCIAPGEVTYCEFEDYYEGLSVGMPDDQDFINVLKNSWGI